MDDYIRRCALPECGVTIENIPGRPERRYCTAVHRASARQARRAAMRPEQRARLAETLPWVAEPPPSPSQPRTSEPTGGRNVPTNSPMAPKCARGWGSGLRRRSAVALFSAVGILAGSYSVTASDPVRPPAVPLVEEAPGNGPADEWAARAEVVLASVEQQLDVLADTEAAWNVTKGKRAATSTPGPVAALQDRKGLLERRRAALRSQLDSYRALGPTRTDLEVAEQHLDAVEDALTSTSTTSAPTSPDDVAALTVLEEQRDLRRRQRDAKRAELSGLEGNVERATHTPLPDDGQETTAVTDLVKEVIEGGGRDDDEPSRPSPAHRRPDVVAGGREGEHAEERQVTTTSAPPDPRGPRDEAAERRAAHERRAARADAAKHDETVGGGSAPDPAPATKADTGSHHAKKPTGTGDDAAKPGPAPASAVGGEHDNRKKDTAEHGGTGDAGGSTVQRPARGKASPTAGEADPGDDGPRAVRTPDPAPADGSFVVIVVSVDPAGGSMSGDEPDPSPSTRTQAPRRYTPSGKHESSGKPRHKPDADHTRGDPAASEPSSTATDTAGSDGQEHGGSGSGGSGSEKSGSEKSGSDTSEPETVTKSDDFHPQRPGSGKAGKTREAPDGDSSADDSGSSDGSGTGTDSSEGDG